MTCEDFVRHEQECRHRGRTRYKLRDGCTVYWCFDCAALWLPNTGEALSATMVDGRNRPLSEEGMTFSDVLGRMIEELSAEPTRRHMQPRTNVGGTSDDA